MSSTYHRAMSFNMAQFVDQMGRTIAVAAQPQRIVSLVPSQTELLIHFGLEEQLIGRTQFCIHPAPIVATIPAVGGTKNFKLAEIAALEPDLIVGNKEENNQEGIEWLAERFPVWMSDVRTYDDALKMIADLGALTGRSLQAKVLLGKLAQLRDGLQPIRNPIRVAYLIWHNPIMAAGSDTFINELLKLCGFINPLTRHDGRYPQVTVADLQLAQLDAIFLSSEPFRFRQRHIAWYQERIENVVVKPIDGELFSWYGNRLLKAIPYMQALINEFA